MCQRNSKLLLCLKEIMNCVIFNITFCYCMVHTLMGTFSVLGHIYYFLLYMKQHVKAPTKSRHHVKHRMEGHYPVSIQAKGYRYEDVGDNSSNVLAHQIFIH